MSDFFKSGILALGSLFKSS